MVKRIILSVILLTVVAFMAGPVFAEQGALVNLKINISPFQGEAGTAIAVDGSGAQAGETVRVTLSTDSAASTNALASVEATPAADGTFNTSLTVPAELTEGKYYVRAEQTVGGSTYYYYNSFRVGAVANATLLPTTGSFMGTPLTVTALLALVLLSGMVVKGFHGAFRGARRPASVFLSDEVGF